MSALDLLADASNDIPVNGCDGGSATSRTETGSTASFVVSPVDTVSQFSVSALNASTRPTTKESYPSVPVLQQTADMQVPGLLIHSPAANHTTNSSIALQQATGPHSIQPSADPFSRGSHSWSNMPNLQSNLQSNLEESTRTTPTSWTVIRPEVGYANQSTPFQMPVIQQPMTPAPSLQLVPLQQPPSYPQTYFHPVSNYQQGPSLPSLPSLSSMVPMPPMMTSVQQHSHQSAYPVSFLSSQRTMNPFQPTNTGPVRHASVGLNRSTPTARSFGTPYLSQQRPAPLQLSNYFSSTPHQRSMSIATTNPTSFFNYGAQGHARHSSVTHNPTVNQPSMSQHSLPRITLPPAPVLTQHHNDELEARAQKPRHAHDLYTPVWVRRSGPQKEGQCRLCTEPKWFQLKNSAYWYHLQFYHGISSTSGKPFRAPVKTRVVNQTRKEGDSVSSTKQVKKLELEEEEEANLEPSSPSEESHTSNAPLVLEGLCHQCNQWILMATQRRKHRVLWYRHAHRCHVYARTEEFSPIMSGKEAMESPVKESDKSIEKDL